MKKNNSSIIKTSLILLTTLVISIVAIIVGQLLFIKDAVKLQAQTEDSISIAEQTQYDYIIDGTSDAQINSFKTSENVTYVAPYYSTYIKIEQADPNLFVRLLGVDKVEDIEKTEFSSERIIEGKKEIGQDAIFIEYAYAQKYGLKIGDKLTYGALSFTVERIYKSTEKNYMMAPYLKTMVNNIQPNGVYIEVKNKTAFENVDLAGYKPLATLKTREQFTSDEVYEEYIAEFNATDYSDHISYKLKNYETEKEEYNNAIKDVKASYLKAGLVIGAIIFVVLMILLVLGGIRKEVVKKGNTKEIKARYCIASIMALITSIVGIIVAFMLASKGLTNYIALSAILSQGIMVLVLPVVAIIVSLVISLAVVSSYSNKKKTKARTK